MNVADVLENDTPGVYHHTTATKWQCNFDATILKQDVAMPIQRVSRMSH